MLTIIKKLSRNYENYMTQKGRERARELLLLSDDRTLADAGFSRELLERGVKAWPWMADTETVELKPLNLSLLGREKAMKELEACTDKELRDLGISRGGIAEAVLQGREGIERETERKVA
jgi:uncharacterized protein YjiS (DUF1127 family)